MFKGIRPWRAVHANAPKFWPYYVEKPGTLTRGLLFFPLPQILSYETEGSQRMRKILHPIPSVLPISNLGQNKFKKRFLTAHGPEGQSRNRPQSCSAVLNLLRHAIGKYCNENKFQVHSWLIRTFTQKCSPLPLSVSI